MENTPEAHGFSKDHVDYLTHHSQQFHGPTDFDTEVQKHLDKLYANKSKPAPTALPSDWVTPDQSYQTAQRQSQNALQNIAAGGPPSIPAPPTQGLPSPP